MIKIRNTKIITFRLIDRKAILQLTPSKEIEIDENTVFACRYMGGWSSYILIRKEKDGYISYPISVKVAKQISKYFESNGNGFNYDYFRMPFEKFYFA